MKLGAEHLDDLALGSVFLATGGGGDPLKRGLEIAQCHGLRISPDRGRP